MPTTRPHCAREFKSEAVQLVKTGGRSIAQIAADLGASAQSLRNWVNQYEVDAGQREGLTTQEREELSRLRRENRILRHERDILKCRRLLRPGDQREEVDVVQFIEREKADHDVRAMCHVLEVSTSGYNSTPAEFERR